MRRHFFEWLNSRFDPRFKAYREARLIYEAYINKLNVQFHALAPKHCIDASQDLQLRRAELLYRQAIELSRKSAALHDVATGLYQLGMLQHLQGRIHQACQSFERSVKILKELPHSDLENQAILSGCCYHLGIISCRNGHIEEGKSLISDSLRIDELLNDSYGITASRSALAKCEEITAIDIGIDEGSEDLDMGLGPSTKGNDMGADAHSGRSTSGSAQENSYRDYENNSPQNNQDDIPINLKSQNNVVWLLSHSVEANDKLFTNLEQLAGQINQKLIIYREAFGRSLTDKSTPQSLEHNEKLCAAIVIIEKEGLGNPDFRYWLKWCIANVADKEDFRLFVYLHDLTDAEIYGLAKSDDLLANLIDTVQMSESTAPEHLHHALRSYLQQLDGLRSAAIWRKLRIISAVYLGRVATGIQIFCGALLTASIFTYAVREDLVISLLSGSSKQSFAVISGIVLFPVIITPMYLLLSGNAAANFLLRNNPRVIPWLISFVVLAPATISLPQHVGAPVSYIALGIYAGILLELTRRKGVLAQRKGLSLKNALKAIKSQFFPRYLLKSISDRSRDLMHNPLFSEHTPRVFISYTRSSDWSRRCSLELHNMLQKAGAKSFLDRESIEEGSSWRTHLNLSITDANVFIVVIDRHSVTRDWVAAEIMTAMAGKQLTGLPEIIVLIEPNMIKTTEMLPVFSALLEGYGSPQKQGDPRLIAVGDSTLQTLVLDLSHRFRTLSVFPRQLSSLFMFITIPLVFIGTIGSFLGWPSAIFAYLQYWQKYDSAAILLSLGILKVAYLLCGYWLGFISRLALASWFEVKNSNPTLLTIIQVVPCIGLAGLLDVWSSSVGHLIIGWAFVLCYTGWLLGSLFISNVISNRSDLNKLK